MKIALALALCVLVAVLCLADGRHHGKKRTKLGKHNSHIDWKKHGGEALRSKLEKLIRSRKHKKHLSLERDEWLKSPHLNYHKDCPLDCPSHQVCVKDPKTENVQCVKKHYIKEGRKLFKKFHKRKNLETRKSVGDTGIHDEVDYLMARRKGGNHGGVREGMKLEGSSSSHHGSLHRVASKDRIQLEKPHDVHISVHTQHTQTPVEGGLEELVDATGRCEPNDLVQMRKRLTGWFVLIHSQQRDEKHQGSHHNSHRDNHHRAPRASVKKDLTLLEHHEYSGKCNCLRSVMWEFRQLDKDGDRRLNHTEMNPIEENHSERCVRPFLDQCDHNLDSKLSKSEWCCCFSDVVPPCYSQLREITDGVHAKPGVFVPRCDNEGYFVREQCHGSTGQCWCVDLNGNEVAGTRTRGMAHCDKIDALGNKSMK